MMSLRSSFEVLRRYFIGLGVVISIAYLMFYYRNVGLHDGLVYIQAGQDIANGKNPYSEGITRSGTVSSLLIYFIYIFIPKTIAAQVFQLINFACIGWFLWVIRGKQWKIEDYLLAVLVSFWLSPVRELLAINQVNAFVVALLGTAIWINSKTPVRKKYLINAGIGLCFALAIDLKPHLLLVVLLVWAVFNRSVAVFNWTISLFATLHIAIDLYIGEITELTWISRILEVEATASTTKLGDSVTFWPIFQRLFPQWIELVPRISILLLLFVCLTALYMAIRDRINSAIVFALAAPGFYIYFHFYDMIPIALIFVVYLINLKISFQHITLLSLMLIPKEFTNLKNLVLVLCITTLVWFWRNAKNKRTSSIELFLGLMGYGVICIINSFFFGGPRLTQSIFVTEILIFLLWSTHQLGKQVTQPFIKKAIKA